MGRANKCDKGIMVSGWKGCRKRHTVEINSMSLLTPAASSVFMFQFVDNKPLKVMITIGLD